MAAPYCGQQCNLRVPFEPPLLCTDTALHSTSEHANIDKGYPFYQRHLLKRCCRRPLTWGSSRIHIEAALNRYLTDTYDSIAGHSQAASQRMPNAQA